MLCLLPLLQLGLSPDSACPCVHCFPGERWVNRMQSTRSSCNLQAQVSCQKLRPQATGHAPAGPECAWLLITGSESWGRVESC